MSRAFVYIIMLLLVPFPVWGQNGEKVFRFLNLPTSTHVNALGGNNVSLVDNDISLVFHNPALLGAEMDMNLNINYMSYLADIGTGSAIFGKAVSPISAFAIGASYLDYGSFKRTSEENIASGEFGSKDIVINGMYSRDLSPYIRGGVTAKFIYSSYEEYTSTAIGFDVGLSYYNDENMLSAGIVVKNLGAQLSAYDEQRARLPWDIQLGLTKKIINAPLRFSVTAMYLTQWNFEKINEANGLEPSDDNFTQTLFKHTVLAADILLSKSMWIGVGFSPKVNSDLKLTEGNKWGGFNAGAGISIKKFKVGFSFGQYHPSATSFHFSLSTDLSAL
ncbi:MAG: type IX secretion system protein PorQ [Prevotella sp.]|nr:type IX secretion system protein PorQ [Prevotella sp.]